MYDAARGYVVNSMQADSSDAELIARARDGDDLAFRTIVERYEPVVAATVIGMLGRGDDADDVGQETFIRFYRALRDFRGGTVASFEEFSSNFPASGTADYRAGTVTPFNAWYRCSWGPDTNVNLHVFTAGCDEVDRMVLFRDRLRKNQADRDLYAAAKRDLAAKDWKYVQQYADAKSEVVGEIMRRATGSR